MNTKIASEIQAEQDHGRQKYGHGPNDFEHDDNHTAVDWYEMIMSHASKICYETPMDGRQRLVKVAGLAVSAIEVIDRKRNASALNCQCDCTPMELCETCRPAKDNQSREDSPLRANVEGEEIVIRMGIERLDCDKGRMLIEVTDYAGFAEEVCQQLRKDNEIGATLLGDCIDAAINAAVDNGSVHAERIEMG